MDKHGHPDRDRTMDTTPQRAKSLLSSESSEGVAESLLSSESSVEVAESLLSSESLERIPFSPFRLVRPFRP